MISASESIALHIVHVSAVLTMLGYTFYAFAADPSRRKSVLAISGIAALIVAGTGFRMWQAQFGWAFGGWIIVKIVCWLGLAALTGIGFRRRGNPGLLAFIALTLTTIAVIMVYAKPF